MIRPNRFYGVSSARTAQSQRGTPPPDGGKEEKRGARSLAMAYIPGQEYEDLYSPAEALSHGTLFKELDMPFHGCFRL